MVGVPGRVKACSTCRKRKKKCDLQTPICGNCARGKRVCGGYVREMLIVHVDKSGKGTYQPQKPISERTWPSENQSIQAPSPTDVRIRDLNRTSLELLSFNVFWDAYLPSQTAARGGYFPFVSGSVGRWVGYTAHYVPQSEIVRCALLALSTSQLAKATQDKHFLQRGFELYGQALSQLAKALKAPGGQKHFGVINGCRLLALFEQYYDVDGKHTASNWRGHVNGLVNLIQYHPLETLCLPGKHEVFLEARLEGILSALCYRKATFLSSPGWMTKPWVGRTKSASDTALDIAVKLPGMLEEWGIVMCRARSPETDERARRLKQRLWQIHTELMRWYEEYIALYKNTFADSEGLELLVASKDSPAQQANLPDVLIRQGVAPLYAMAIYWTCCTILYPKMLQVYEVFTPSTPAEAELLKAPRLNLLKYCICVARSTKILLEPGAGLASSTLFAGTAVAFVIAAYNTSDTETEAEREDMEELERGLQDLMGRKGSMWSQTWKAVMKKMEMRHNQSLTHRGESSRRFWAGSGWFQAYDFPLTFID